MMKLQRIEVFSAVAKHLNLSRAARELHVTPSAVSHLVKKLERDLGVQLIRQTRRGVALTDSGSSARRDVNAILARINALEKKFRR